MPLPKPDVQRWLETVAPKVGMTRVALDAGLPRLRVVQQLHSGSVAEATVVAIARSKGLDPLETLASFPAYASLCPASPAPHEAMSLIGAGPLLRAAGARVDGLQVREDELGPIHFEGSSRQWFAACDDGTLRERTASELGLGRTGLWRMLNGTIRPDVASLVAKVGGTPLCGALVVADVLAPAEAGWKPGERAEALNRAPVSTLMALAELRAHEAGLRGKQDENYAGHLG